LSELSKKKWTDSEKGDKLNEFLRLFCLQIKVAIIKGHLLRKRMRLPFWSIFLYFLLYREGYSEFVNLSEFLNFFVADKDIEYD